MTVEGGSFEVNMAYSSLLSPGMGGAVFLTTAGAFKARNASFDANTVVPPKTAHLKGGAFVVGSQLALVSFTNASAQARLQG